MYLAADPDADKFLATQPLGLLIGMLLDQQIPLERAFSAPYELAQRLGVSELSARELAAMDPTDLIATFSIKPALHRFPKAMAERTQRLAELIVEKYDGDAAQVWQGADSGKELLRRITELPGFGPQKAKIFLSLLGKQFDVRPPGWEAAGGEFAGPGYHSVADITDAASLQRVREYKQAKKAQASS